MVIPGLLQMFPLPPQAQAGVLASGLVAVTEGVGTTAGKRLGVRQTEVQSLAVLLSWQIV